MADREWFVSYDVTDQAIEVTRLGDDPATITADEALLLRDDLMAAVVAHNEHRILRGDDDGRNIDSEKGTE